MLSPGRNDTPGRHIPSELLIRPPEDRTIGCMESEKRPVHAWLQMDLIKGFDIFCRKFD